MPKVHTVFMLESDLPQRNMLSYVTSDHVKKGLGLGPACSTYFAIRKAVG